MTTGTIKKLVADRGFGFITAEDGKEYFFHRSSIENFDSLRGNERVDFDVEDSPKGPRAAQVRVSQAVAEPAPAAAEAVAEAPAAEESHDQEGHDHEGHDHEDHEHEGHDHEAPAAEDAAPAAEHSDVP